MFYAPKHSRPQRWKAVLIACSLPISSKPGIWSAAPGVTPDGWYIRREEIDDLNWRSEAARQPLLTWLNNEQRLISDVSAKPVYISSFFAGKIWPDGYRQLLEHVKATGVNVWVQMATAWVRCPLNSVNVIYRPAPLPKLPPSKRHCL
ncbi:DUF4434 domain-containing protein [Escherichia coli]